MGKSRGGGHQKWIKKILNVSNINFSIFDKGRKGGGVRPLSAFCGKNVVFLWSLVLPVNFDCHPHFLTKTRWGRPHG